MRKLLYFKTFKTLKPTILKKETREIQWRPVEKNKKIERKKKNGNGEKW